MRPPVDVWLIDLSVSESQLDQAACLLDREETARAARLQSPALHRRFVASHAALRQILARTLSRTRAHSHAAGLAHAPGVAGAPGVARTHRCTDRGDAPRPEHLQFVREPGGRPALANAPAPLHFSLSHAGDLALVATCVHGPLGIDVEGTPIPPALHHDLQPHLALAERQALARRPAGRRDRGACRAWVRKEALLKAVGCGLSGELSRLVVGCDGPVRLLHAGWPGLESAHWFLTSLEQPTQWIGALAIRGPARPVRLRRWHWPAADRPNDRP
jgi:4'-phosphopantetheinyl transferase